MLIPASLSAMIGATYRSHRNDAPQGLVRRDMPRRSKTLYPSRTWTGILTNARNQLASSTTFVT